MPRSRSLSDLIEQNRSSKASGVLSSQLAMSAGTPQATMELAPPVDQPEKRERSLEKEEATSVKKAPEKKAPRVPTLRVDPLGGTPVTLTGDAALNYVPGSVTAAQNAQRRRRK